MHYTHCWRVVFLFFIQLRYWEVLRTDKIHFLSRLMVLLFDMLEGIFVFKFQKVSCIQFFFLEFFLGHNFFRNVKNPIWIIKSWPDKQVVHNRFRKNNVHFEKTESYFQQFLPISITNPQKFTSLLPNVFWKHDFTSRFVNCAFVQIINHLLFGAIDIELEVLFWYRENNDQSLIF